MHQSLTILMLVTRRQLRGAEVSAANLAKQLIKKGHRVLWVGLYPPISSPVEVEGAMNMDLGGSDQFFLSIKKVRALRRLIQKEGVQVVQANGSDNLKYAVAACLLLRDVSLIYRNISMISYWMDRNHFKKWFYRLLMTQVQHVVSVGQSARNDFMKTLHYPSDKISVIHRGIPIPNMNREECRQSVLNEFGLPEHVKLLIWAGALSEEKDPFLALKIMESLADKEPIYLLLVGTGTMRSDVERYLDSVPQLKVLYTGYRTDLYRLLSAADLLLLTSKVEGVPGVVLEAAVCGTPSVCSNVGGVAEAILYQQTGILLSDRSAARFATVIKQLVDSPEQCKRMGTAARMFAETTFSEEKLALRFEDLYQQLLKRTS